MPPQTTQEDSMKSVARFGASAFVVAMLAFSAATVQAVPVYNPGNGHYYELVMTGAPITWAASNAAATSMGGYLATLTSAAEDSFVWSQYSSFLGDSAGNVAYVGGYQPAGTGEPSAGWQWVTGEVWSYTNWAGGEPNDCCGGEDFLHLGWYSNGQWNDIYEGGQTHNYIVEWNTNPVPEPGTLALLASGLSAFVARRRRSSV
jgi:hypothetical protein